MLRKEFLDNLIKTEKTLFDEVFLLDGNVNVGCNIFLQALGALLSHDGQVSKEKIDCALRGVDALFSCVLQHVEIARHYLDVFDVTS